MEDLKEHWIREVEEIVTADTKPLSTKDDDEADQLDNEADSDDSDPNVTSFVGGAFDNSTSIATPQVSFDFAFGHTVDTIDPVNFNTSPFTSDIPVLSGYDLMSHAAGMSNYPAQQFVSEEMFQTFDENNFAQHLVSQESAQYLSSSPMW